MSIGLSLNTLLKNSILPQWNVRVKSIKAGCIYFVPVYYDSKYNYWWGVRTKLEKGKVIETTRQKYKGTTKNWILDTKYKQSIPKHNRVRQHVCEVVDKIMYRENLVKKPEKTKIPDRTIQKWSDVFWFGKHRGETLKTVFENDFSYITFMLLNDFNCLNFSKNVEKKIVKRIGG